MNNSGNDEITFSSWGQMNRTVQHYSSREAHGFRLALVLIISSAVLTAYDSAYHEGVGPLE